MNSNGSSARGTDNSSAKRVRISEQAEEGPMTISPVTAAKAAFAQGASALPVAIQDTVKNEMQNYIALIHKLRSKEKSLKKYDDDSYIPQSLLLTTSS